MPDDLAPQLEHVRRAADAFGVCQIEMANFEADDLIATYARHAVEAGATVTILSSDKDMMQLVSDGRVTMRDPMTDRPIGEAEVREEFGVGPDKVIEVQALRSEEHTSELQSPCNLVCRLLLEKKKERDNDRYWMIHTTI